MPSMSYCVFENTAGDLSECVSRIFDDLSQSEHVARLQIIDMAADIFDALGVTFDEDALREAKRGLDGD